MERIWKRRAQGWDCVFHTGHSHIRYSYNEYCKFNNGSQERHSMDISTRREFGVNATRSSTKQPQEETDIRRILHLCLDIWIWSLTEIDENVSLLHNSTQRRLLRCFSEQYICKFQDEIGSTNFFTRRVGCRSVRNSLQEIIARNKPYWCRDYLRSQSSINTRGVVDI